jgi:CheY-like chemotaxis protein
MLPDASGGHPTAAQWPPGALGASLPVQDPGQPGDAAHPHPGFPPPGIEAQCVSPRGVASPGPLRRRSLIVPNGHDSCSTWSARAREGREVRVLVTDTDADVRGVIADLLVGPAFEIELAADPQEACRALEAGGVDVFLCDLDLLRRDHGRLGRFVRSLAARPRLVAMSATGNGTSSRESDASLAKPFSRSQLLAAIAPGAGAPSRSSPTPRA